MPFWRPDPLTSLIDRDGNPLSSSSGRIGSNASWRMNASIFFICVTSSLERRLCRAAASAVIAVRAGAPTGCRRRRDADAIGAARILLRRDELLRVSVHPVRGDVQSGDLFLVVDPQPDRLLDREERAYESTNTNANVGDDADRLDGELADRRAEPASPKIPYQTPGAAPSRIRRAEPNSPIESVPQIPARPCADSAPTGSSRYLSIARRRRRR